MLESAITLRHSLNASFDVPLRALLYARGFYDLELFHGVSEYGRDFIAKRRDVDGSVRSAHGAKRIPNDSETNRIDSGYHCAGKTTVIRETRPLDSVTASIADVEAGRVAARIVMEP